MLAGPSVPIFTMRRALAHTLAALDAAAAVDIDRTTDDHAFFSAQRSELAHFVPELAKAQHALEEFDLGPGMANQVFVELGDVVLDRGVRAGNTRAKLELKGTSSLGAEHVFGKRVADLIGAKLALEPSLVLQAVQRLDDVDDFDGKDAMKKDLTQRADKQEELLDTRDAGYAVRNQLESATLRLITDAAHALAKTKGALDSRFTRQRDYVATFFLDAGSPRPVKNGDPTPTGGGGAPATSPEQAAEKAESR